MAGRRKCVGPVNYHELPRKKLQALCKKYGFQANRTNVAMADALTALLNAPERLAGRIDSPAISSKSSYLSSCEVEESPMISPGVDSMPTISELRPEVFGGLRITKLPEIIEVHTSPRVTVNNIEEMRSRYETDKMHTSEIIERMTDNSAAAESPYPDSNGQDMEVSENDQTDSAMSEGPKIDKEVKEMECSENLQTMDVFSPGNDREYKGMDCIDVTDAIIDDFVASAGPSSDDEGKDVQFSENRQTEPSESSRSEEVLSANEARNVESEDRFQAILGSQHVDKPEPTPNVRLEVLVSTSGVMKNTPLPISEEMTDASDRRLDEVTELVEVITTSGPNSEDKMKGSSEELRESVTRDSTAERVTNHVEFISATDHVTEASTISELNYETAEAEDNTPIPLSVMPHSSVSDLSVSNKKGVRLVVELNSRRFPGIDMFETDGDIKISSHTSEGMKSRGGSQGLPNQETEDLRMAWRQDEVFGFKCLNPAALSPKVRRSLGIDIPKIPVSKRTFSATCRASPVKENENEFSFDVPLISPVVSPATLSPDKVTDSWIAMDIERNTSVYHERPSTIEAETNCLSNDERSETTRLVPRDQENEERSQSCSPVPGYVKEIVNLLENKSEEKDSRELAGAGRKDVYKQSPLVRSSRIAADIERASKLGQAKRAGVLAGKRSLLPPTNSSSSLQAAELNHEETEALQITSSGSLTRDGTTGSNDEHDSDVDQVLQTPNAEESSCVHVSSETTREDTPGSTQHAMKAGNTQPDSLVPPTQVGELTDGGISVNKSPPIERTETILSASVIAEKDHKSSPKDVVNDDSSTSLSDKITDAGLPEIRYVEIPRPVETNVECGPISELSWIRKATNLPTPKSQKLNEKIKRPVSANLRKFELMEKAALNSAKKHRTPKKTTNAKGETPDESATNVSGSSASSESQEPTEDVVDVEMEELSSAPVDPSLRKSPDKSTARPLSLRDCNKELGISTVESCPVSPKSPAISLDEILRENTQSRGKENLRGKENERLRRHQEEYKTPITGRAKEKAIRTAEMNAANLREKILKQRRGIEEEEPSGNSANALKNPLLSRLL